MDIVTVRHGIESLHSFGTGSEFHPGTVRKSGTMERTALEARWAVEEFILGCESKNVLPSYSHFAEWMQEIDKNGLEDR